MTEINNITTHTVEIPSIEILAAFRQSFRTAEREGFPRTAAQVAGYLEALDKLDEIDRNTSYANTWTITLTIRH